MQRKKKDKTNDEANTLSHILTHVHIHACVHNVRTHIWRVSNKTEDNSTIIFAVTILQPVISIINILTLTTSGTKNITITSSKRGLVIGDMIMWRT